MPSSTAGTDTVELPGAPASPPGSGFTNVLALDGTPLAWTQDHGQALRWLAP